MDDCMVHGSGIITTEELKDYEGSTVKDKRKKYKVEITLYEANDDWWENVNSNGIEYIEKTFDMMMEEYEFYRIGDRRDYDIEVKDV